MDIKITDKSLRKFLETKADPDTISKDISLCGPTFDRVQKVKNDYLYEIEAITNRVDTASALGVAREAAVILNQFGIPAKLVSDPYREKVTLRPAISKQFHLNIGKDLVDRFTAVSIEKITVKPSPRTTADLLENCDLRPINNLVDITNELTLLYGLPSHIFDLDKLATQSLTIRESKKGETIVTLDGVKNILRGGDIVIEDGSGRLVDLCGIMGGQIAEVDSHTKNALLIVPVYQPKKIRQTSLYLQKRTQAAQIYEKQADPELCLPLVSQAIQLIKERSGGIVSSPLFDFYPTPLPPKIVSIDFNWLNSFIGTTIKKETVISILAGLGFSGTEKDGVLSCVVPSWRYQDINIKEDLAEEVARIYGYFRLPGQLPSVRNIPEPDNKLLTTELNIKKYLSAIGYHEIYNNSLLSLENLESNQLKPAVHLKLVNALSTDFEYLRTSLVPSLLGNLRHNQGKVIDVVRLFEIANVYIKQKELLPLENSTLATLSTLDYRQAKGEIESLFSTFKIASITFKPAKDAPAPFHSSGTAAVYSDRTKIGYFGLIRPEILRSLGLQSIPVVSEIDLVGAVGRIKPGHLYEPVSEFPHVREDMTISSPKNLGDIIEEINNSSTLIKEIQYLESYHNKHTFKVSFGSSERNLEQKEINALKELIQNRFRV